MNGILTEILIILKVGDTYSLMLATTLFCSIAALWSLYYQSKIRRWPFVLGELKERGVDKFGAADLVIANQDYVVKVNYHYQVNGRNYIGDRLSPTIIIASHNAKVILERQLRGVSKVGDKVKVFYNPARPSKSFLILPGLYSSLFTLFMLFLMVWATVRVIELASL